MIQEPIISLIHSFIHSAELVAQSVMSATDTLGHRDINGLSAIDPCPRQWICVCTMPKDIGMPL